MSHLDSDSSRRGFLKCMAWAGTGLVWSLSAGMLSACSVGAAAKPAGGAKAALTFVQISDSHIGFQGMPNADVTATLRRAIQQIDALPNRPAFILHTGDISHLATADQFDTVYQIVKSSKTSQAFYVPGEHDTFTDNGKAYLDRFGQGATGKGWQSFDYSGAHFIGLINVWNLKAGGFGTLGQEQLDWLRQDLQGRSSSTPIVVYAHVPLWSVYPTWGWGTDDAGQALALLRRFDSVTVLNGHIHQILEKVDGKVTFHTAASTAFPLPAPGEGDSPGPLQVRSDQLISSLGVREVIFMRKPSAPVVIDAQIQ
jgi:3',5'-cyclic-AMP phosphodiesterase